MSFKDKSFSERYEKLGDEAEGIFESVYSHGFVKYGLSRPPINLATVPAFVRYTPDYLTAKGLVEVQGFGRDQTFKIKDDKLFALEQWMYATEWRVDLFVWDSWNRQYGWIRLPQLMDDPHYWNDVFPEGKPYYAWEARNLPVDKWFSLDAGGVTRQS